MSTYTPIATQTIASDTPSITFSSLPQNYTDIIAVVNAKWSSYWSFGIRFNDDSGSNYSETVMQGTGSSPAGSFRNSNANRTSGCQLGPNWGTAILQFQNYSNGTTYKTGVARSGESTGQVRASVFLWRNTAPVTSITFITSGGSEAFGAGSTISLYGVAAGNSSAKASGGNIVTTDGSYWYHTFTSSGTFIPSQALTVDYLVVAGGGGGGSAVNSGNSEGAGGGGAGGLRSTVTATGGGGSLETALSLSANTVYQAIVGAGGAGGAVSNNNGTNGTNSIFSTITSVGGGGGGKAATTGLTGGSGGGGGAGPSAPYAGGSRTVNQGFAGGSGYFSARAGGGGGAGAVGEDASSGNVRGGNGGAGVAVSITGSSVTYAGGGGGGEYATGGTGGSGGGGNGGSYSPSVQAQAGTTNRGAGGGGASFNLAAGSGGSGIVIIRYAV